MKPASAIFCLLALSIFAAALLAHQPPADSATGPAQNAANTKWVKDYYAALQPHSAAGGYVNFMAGDEQGRVRDSYKGNYDRLVQVKKKYDPQNLFHVNQNIKPA